MVESFGKSFRESVIPPGYSAMAASEAFHGPSFGSNVSRWLAPPLRLMKTHARAEFFTAGRLLVVSASACARSRAAEAAPNRKCRRVYLACRPQVLRFMPPPDASMVILGRISN